MLRHRRLARAVEVARVRRDELLDDALLRPHTRVGAGLLKPKISDGQRD